MRKQTFGIIVALLIVSLGGLVVLQYVLLTDAIKQKEETFRQNVHSAMNAVAKRLEAREAVGHFFKMVVNANATDRKRVIQVNLDTTVAREDVKDSVILFAGVNLEQPPIWFSQDSIRYTLGEPQHVSIRVYDAVGREDTVLIDTFKEAGSYALKLDDVKYREGEYFYKVMMDKSSYTMKVNDGDMGGVVQSGVMFERKKQIIGKVIDDLASAEREPIERRIQPQVLDSLIKLSLNEAGIGIPYAFGVIGERDDSLRLIQPETMAGQVRSSEFKTRLFPSDFLFSDNQMALYFPDQNMFLLKQIGIQAALTVLFTAILVFCFVSAVRTIIKQKEFAVRLVEFINNMTHEFKTPISTISVAAETIMRPDVLEQSDKILRYGTVIRDENQRMKTQVDKILQMAVLEEGDFELKLTPIDVHEVIARAVEAVALQVEAKNGALTYDLEAEDAGILADPVHVTNIIYNILDNANKYSPETPDIMVATKNENGKLLVTIADKGIGIGKEEAKKVFDKYYRVPTGNRHDVKGFGLGLSYVKLMMNAHRGDVSLASEPGKGTAVTLMFPLDTSGTKA